MNQLESSFSSSMLSNAQAKELEKLNSEPNNLLTLENEFSNQSSSLRVELARVDEGLKEFNSKNLRLISSLEEFEKEIQDKQSNASRIREEISTIGNITIRSEEEE